MKHPSFLTHQKLNQRGFSIVEALFGLILTMIGFTAVFRLQGAQMKASLSARDMSAASNLAEYGITELTRDSYEWNSQTRVGERLGQLPAVWHSLTPYPVDQNAQPHIRDDDQGTALNRQRFCVHYWFGEFGGLYEGLLNARVRVVWPRDPRNQRLIESVCGEGKVDNFDNDTSQWLSVTVPFILRRHP
jgi:hypothetical protein